MEKEKERKRAKHAKTCELLLLFVCGFVLILADLQGVIAAVRSILGICCSILGAVYKAVFVKGWPVLTGKQGKAQQSSSTLIGFVNDVFKLSCQK